MIPLTHNSHGMLLNYYAIPSQMIAACVNFHSLGSRVCLNKIVLGFYLVEFLYFMVLCSCDIYFIDPSSLPKVLNSLLDAIA
jgi:hypothetical protein